MTAGATVRAAAAALRAGGWEVVGVLALGLAVSATGTMAATAMAKVPEPVAGAVVDTPGTAS